MIETGTDERIRLRDALFKPRSVALVGVSDDVTRTTARPLKFLRQHAFEGAVYPVNPNRDTVQGEAAYPNLTALPEVPDHIYVLVGADATLETIAEAAKLGVPAATLLADGFADSGAEGVDRQRRLVQSARAAGLRLVGPNSLGLVNVNTGLILSANAAFAEDELLKGSVAVLSQSGSMIGAFMSRGLVPGIGFSKLVSVGNEADLSVGRLGRLLADDPETDVFLLFLETIRDAEEIAAFATEAHRHGKPVLAFMLGRTGEGRELAVLHTGALLADGASVDAFLRDAGIARLDSLEALLEAVPLFRGRGPLAEKSPKVGVVTTTGGGGATLVDALATRGLEIGRASEATLAAIGKAGIRPSPGPMVDVTLAGAQYDVMRGTLEAMAGGDEFDVVLAAIGSSARFNPDLALQPIIDCKKQGKPFGAYLVPEAPRGCRALTEAGIPAFRSAWTCADAIRALADWRPPRAEALSRPMPGDRSAGRVLDEAASLELLAARGLPVVPHLEVAFSEVADVDLPFTFPVVAKVSSSQVAHKTDAGGVITGLGTREELVHAVGTIKSSVEQHLPDVRVGKVLIAPMVEALGEALLSVSRDGQVGPVVTLAPGGILAELHDDKSVRLAPVDRATAREMIDEVTGLAPLRGYRNLPRGDLEALAETIATFSTLLAGDDPAILDAEINPLLIWQDGVVAVDALVRLAD